MSREETRTPLKRVRIVGPDHNGALGFVFKDGFKNKEGHLIIGDGKNTVTPEEIKEQLEGRIDKDTHIDILAHGSVSLFGFGWHEIKLLPEEFSFGYRYILEALKFDLDPIKPSPISYILGLLDSLTSDPVQIYLTSCYGGAAGSSIKYLKPGSTLITTSRADKVSFSSPIDHIDFLEGLSPEAKFLHVIKQALEPITFNKYSSITGD